MAKEVGLVKDGNLQVLKMVKRLATGLLDLWLWKLKKKEMESEILEIGSGKSDEMGSTGFMGFCGVSVRFECLFFFLV